MRACVRLIAMFALHCSKTLAWTVNSFWDALHVAADWLQQSAQKSLRKAVLASFGSFANWTQKSSCSLCMIFPAAQRGYGGSRTYRRRLGFAEQQSKLKGGLLWRSTLKGTWEWSRVTTDEVNLRWNHSLFLCFSSLPHFSTVFFQRQLHGLDWKRVTRVCRKAGTKKPGRQKEKTGLWFFSSYLPDFSLRPSGLQLLTAVAVDFFPTGDAFETFCNMCLKHVLKMFEGSLKFFICFFYWYLYVFIILFLGNYFGKPPRWLSAPADSFLCTCAVVAWSLSVRTVLLWPLHIMKEQ